jgi:hypothetical protein
MALTFLSLFFGSGVLMAVIYGGARLTRPWGAWEKFNASVAWSKTPLKHNRHL